MSYDVSFLVQCFQRTNGRCHLCGGDIHLAHYGCVGRSGSWEVDHDIPRAHGGGDDVENLLPAHVSCNRSKQAYPSELVRAGNGLSRRPMSEDERGAAQIENALSSGVTVGVVAGIAGAVLTPKGEDPVANGLKWGLCAALFGVLLGGLADPE